MNLHQSEGIAGVMLRAGYTLADTLESADVVLFNGCTVRQKAEEKVYGRIGVVVAEKRRRELLLGVGGCLGQIHGAALLKRCPAIDFLFGTRAHAALPALIDRVRRDGRPPAGVDERTEIDEMPFHRRSPVRAMVTITEGCSNFCSYCIVPYARGPMRSRAPDRILAEVEEAAAAGFREALLLGQNVNSYGADRADYGTFTQLLRRVAETGIARVRFTSSHPRDMSIGVLETMAALPNICHHLHLACQSGSDRILKEMNRGISRAGFLKIVEAAREIVQEINLTTDLIVGYPGETEDDFEATMDLMERVRFGSIYAAKYSPRPGTRSAREADDVPASVKEERLSQILSRQREIALEENERSIGEEASVLIEGATRGGFYGRADDHRTVVVDGPASIGDVVLVRVTGASAASLSGAILVSEGVMGAP